MRGKIVKRLAAEIVMRAKMFVGDKRIHYHLAYPNGGTDPQTVPQDGQTGGCDCIGFAANCAGFDRYQPGQIIRPNGLKLPFPLYDGYINTDSMIEEAKGAGKWFTILKEPKPGCFIVGHSFRKGLFRRRVIGHIGVVVDASEYATKGLAGLQVVHCSPSNVNRPGNVNHSAVWKTDGTVWAGYPTLCFIEFNYDYAAGLK